MVCQQGTCSNEYAGVPAWAWGWRTVMSHLCWLLHSSFRRHLHVQGLHRRPSWSGLLGYCLNFLAFAVVVDRGVSCTGIKERC